MIIKRDFLYTPTGKNRPLHIWLPEGYDRSDERYPVMYFFDGHNLFLDEDATYGKSWGMQAFLEQWGKDMIVVGIECGHGKDERLSEYLPYPASDSYFGALTVLGDRTLSWVVEELKPVIDREYRTWPFRECTAIGGASMGGLMALHGVVRHNRWFSKAACVSSSLGICMEPVLADLDAHPADPDTRVYLSWGSREAQGTRNRLQEDPGSLTYRWNHTVAARLRQTGAETLVYCQPNGGHCEADWEKLVPDFMDFLWMA